MTADIIELARRYGGYGYRKIALCWRDAFRPSNGYIESFNARLRDELLDGEIFYTLKEARIVIESWRRHYHTVRPHASLGYRPPAPEVFVPALAAWPSPPPQPAPTATLPLAPRPPSN